VAEEVTLRRWLIGALASLTSRERAVIVMRYFFDLPEAIVADELHITVGTVKSTSSRALAKLRITAGSSRAEPLPTPPGKPHDRY
jgi:RNA polymerase sigma factor (sigma-70 family)